VQYCTVLYALCSAVLKSAVLHSTALRSSKHARVFHSAYRTVCRATDGDCAARMLAVAVTATVTVTVTVTAACDWVDSPMRKVRGLHTTSKYSTVQHSTLQYSTVQYSTVQYSTVQHSTVLLAQYC